MPQETGANRAAGTPPGNSPGPGRRSQEGEAMRGRIVILGVFVADTAYRAARMPRPGETLLGSEFRLGPGGKGSNQAVAAARSGGAVHLITRLGRDSFARMAHETWRAAGVVAEVTTDDEGFTGAAGIFVEESSGNNAIIICPGVAGDIGPEDITRNAALFRDARVFMTQLEQPAEAAMHGLKLARENGATTILNPAPAGGLPEGMLALCDYVTPNETEAEALSGIAVASVDDACRAALALLDQGAGAALVTLGENGVLYHDGRDAVHVPAFDAGPALDTTGAGDAFNGALAAALARGDAPLEAVRFGCAAAAISVTRHGTAAAMPSLEEVHALMRRAG